MKSQEIGNHGRCGDTFDFSTRRFGGEALTSQEEGSGLRVSPKAVSVFCIFKKLLVVYYIPRSWMTFLSRYLLQDPALCEKDCLLAMSTVISERVIFLKLPKERSRVKHTHHAEWWESHILSHSCDLSYQVLWG